jgi:hypothetical protein
MCREVSSLLGSGDRDRNTVLDRDSGVERSSLPWSRGLAGMSMAALELIGDNEGSEKGWVGDVTEIRARPITNACPLPTNCEVVKGKLALGVVSRAPFSVEGGGVVGVGFDRVMARLTPARSP